MLAESSEWRIVLTRNQNLLGKCFLATHRHVGAVPALTVEEWHDLHRQLIRVTGALEVAFRPDHANYAFLQNQDRHVHLHVIPRGTRELGPLPAGGLMIPTTRTTMRCPP